MCKSNRFAHAVPSEDVFLIDIDNDIWLKCNECGSSYHKSYWKNIADDQNKAISVAL